MEKSKKKYIIAVASIIVLVILAIILNNIYTSSRKGAAPELSIVAENKYEKTITVVSDYDYAPYSFYNEKNQHAGFDLELANALANKMQVNIDVRLMEWPAAIEEVQSGKADLILGLEYNPEYLQKFLLSVPIQSDQFITFGKNDIFQMKELYGKNVGTIDDGDSHSSFLSPYKMNDDLSLYQSYGDAFKALEKDEIDYVISRYSVGRRAIAELESNGIKAVGPNIATNFLCYGTRKGNEAFIEDVDKAIVSLLTDGTIEKLRDRWLGDYVQVLNIGDFIAQNSQFFIIFVLMILVIIATFYFITSKKIAKSKAVEKKQLSKVIEYQNLITETTMGLYESIYEWDITHNCVASETTRQYFESWGISGDTSYDEGITAIARKQIKEEYIDTYLNAFLSHNVMNYYKNGINNIACEFMTSSDGENYYWMRISARIFYWSADDSIRLISYRQNIDNEKRHEMGLIEQAQSDPMTRLYNKEATEILINHFLNSDILPNSKSAFLILDIDNFKQVNDNYGHAFGDIVIKEFAKTIKRQFRESDIVGRIGGDEFAVMLKNIPNEDWLSKEVPKLSRNLNKEITVGEKKCKISASIGVAIYPEAGKVFDSLYKNADSALYITKANGKNGFTVYDKSLKDICPIT